MQMFPNTVFLSMHLLSSFSRFPHTISVFQEFFRIVQLVQEKTHLSSGTFLAYYMLTDLAKFENRDILSGRLCNQRS